MEYIWMCLFCCGSVVGVNQYDVVDVANKVYKNVVSLDLKIY
jgi:hypothetical protein